MTYNFKTAEKIPYECWITKEAEESLCFLAKQMNCEDNEALDILLRYLDENCIRTLKELGHEFDPLKLT